MNITQADRDAVEEFSHNGDLSFTLAHAFASHRIAALEEAAAVAEKTKAYDDNLQKSAGCATTGQHIAKAILALKGQE